jgi:hypothetical protein
LQALQNSELLTELYYAAFEVLLLHPGCDRQQWIDILCSQYAEPYDAYGDDVRQRLLKLWYQPYRDIASGIENTYETWSQMLSTEEDARKYYDMIETKK